VIYRASATFAALAIVLSFMFIPASGQNSQKFSIPFGIDKRPMPTGTDLNVLVPPSVGSFTREQLPPDAKARSDEDLNVTYKSGSDSVFFGFSIPDTPADAYEAVKVTREEAIASKVNMKGEQYVIGKDPSYFKVADFMSWTRGKYFFYAKANSPAALDKFMRAFPF
jgi:hypothetical protein